MALRFAVTTMAAHTGVLYDFRDSAREKNEMVEIPMS